jgi:hypothetical protein
MAEATTRDDYPEVAVFREDDGVIAVITKKVGTEYLGFSLAKEFPRNGKIERTSFLNRRHMASVKRLLARVEEYLDTHTDVTTTRKIGRPKT